MNNKTVLIMGASSGLGEATAYKLARHGCSLGLCARRLNKLVTVARKCEELGAAVYFESIDLTSPGQREAFVNYMLKKFGKIDVLINNSLKAKEITKLVLSKMVENGKGRLVFMEFFADHHSSVKLRTILDSLRQDVSDDPIRISSIDYDRVHPLVGEDIADCVDWVIAGSKYVNVSEINVFPLQLPNDIKVVRR